MLWTVVPLRVFGGNRTGSHSPQEASNSYAGVHQQADTRTPPVFYIPRGPDRLNFLELPKMVLHERFCFLWHT